MILHMFTVLCAAAHPSPCFSGPQGVGESPRAIAIEAPVQHSGTYSVASGSWVHGVGAFASGPTVIYNASCLSSPVIGVLMDPGQSLTDEGRVPSPTGPSDASWNRPGCATAYIVNGFEIAYYTDRASVDIDISFIESYSTCSTPANYPVLASFHLPNMPGAGSSGALVIHVVTIDLTGGAEFAMSADGDGAYDSAGTYGALSGGGDRFGWTIQFSGDSGLAGSVLTGTSNPTANACSARSFDGTSFDPIVDLAEPGVGMSTTEFFWFDYGAWESCTSISWGSFYLRLLSSTLCPARPGTSFCFGDGSGTACPCVYSASTPGYSEGCENHSDGGPGGGGSGIAGVLLADGVPSLSADSLILRAAGMRPNASVLFFQGTQREQGGSGSHFGDGLRCAGGSIRRLGVLPTRPSGTASYPDIGSSPISIRGQVTQPGLRTYQAWYRVAAAYCGPATFNLTNGWEVPWVP